MTGAESPDKHPVSSEPSPGGPGAFAVQRRTVREASARLPSLFR